MHLRTTLVALVAVVVVVACSTDGRTEAEPTARVCVFEDAVEAVTAATVLIFSDDGYGTAFHIGDGQFVTAAHVVGSTDEVILESDTINTRARVVELDELSDTALLHADMSRVPDFPSIEWRVDDVRRGETVGTVGYLASVDEGEGSVSRGTVSGLVERSGVGLIQTDTPVNHGNNGGLLFDNCGRALGVISIQLADDAIDGIAYAIDGASARSALQLPEPQPALVAATGDSTPTVTLSPIPTTSEATATATTAVPSSSPAQASTTTPIEPYLVAAPAPVEWNAPLTADDPQVGDGSDPVGDYAQAIAPYIAIAFNPTGRMGGGYVPSRAYASCGDTPEPLTWRLVPAAAVLVLERGTGECDGWLRAQPLAPATSPARWFRASELDPEDPLLSPRDGGEFTSSVVMAPRYVARIENVVASAARWPSGETVIEPRLACGSDGPGVGIGLSEGALVAVIGSHSAPRCDAYLLVATGYHGPFWVPKANLSDPLTP